MCHPLLSFPIRQTRPPQSDNMSYTKLVAGLARASSNNGRQITRYRSTAASPKSREDRSQMDGCGVVQAEPLELIHLTRGAPEAARSRVAVDFDNTQEAYKSKGNAELLRSLLVFRLCAIDVLVEKNKEVSAGER